MQLAQRHHQSAETMNELRALNARFIHNFVTNDVPSHDAILHPAFINIWPTGQRLDRATYLKYWATAFDPKIIVYWGVRDELITIIGDVALVRATNKHTRRRDGQEVTGMTMYTDTYLFEGGAWKCIQAHRLLPNTSPPTIRSSAFLSRVNVRNDFRDKSRGPNIREHLRRARAAMSASIKDVDGLADCPGSEYSLHGSNLARARTLPARARRAKRS